MGAPIALTDASQNLVWQADYDAFGAVTILQDDVGGFQTRFPGQYEDPETGLYYNWHRYYIPEEGRYIRPDPLGMVDGPNLYAYSMNNPVNYVDPYGLFKICRRPLSFAGSYMSSGSTGLNLGFFHEHGFYEDGSGDNIGYTATGLFDDSANRNSYVCDNRSFDDDIMRYAQENIKNSWKGDDYNFVTNNCQDYIDALLDEYDRLKYPKQPPPFLKPFLLP